MASKTKTPSIGKAVADLWRTVTSDLFNEYRPERRGVPLGVEHPAHHELVQAQMEEAVAKRGPGNLQDLLTGDETWTVS